MSNPIGRVARICGVGVRLVLAAAVVVLVGAASAGAADTVLTGDVGAGDGFTISLTDSNGSAVKHLDAGTYTLVVHDHSSFHNFHLSGLGVDVSTGIDFIGDQTFTVTIADAQYFYNCDPHSAQMKGTFAGGTFTQAPPPSPVPGRLTASIGPGAKFALAPSGGLTAGKFVVTVNDRTTKDGFRLAGPGVARSTGTKFRGSVTWTVTLQPGRYSFGSSKSAKLRRIVTVG